jgi:hypothetical protein
MEGGVLRKIAKADGAERSHHLAAASESECSIRKKAPIELVG